MKREPDYGRSAVYSAENQVSRVVNRGGSVDFFGSTLHVPMQRKFGDIEGVVEYLRALRECSWGHGQTPTPNILPSRSLRKATWVHPNTIRLPTTSDWALTEMVVLHEYAHHVTFYEHDATGHGIEFRNCLVDLVSDAIAPEAGLLLTAALDQAGVGQTG